MTVGKISALCWTFFVIMSVAFLPAILGVTEIPWLPHGARIPIGVAVVIAAWWGPFIYAMYLSMAAVKNGDRRLLKRGIRGRALVLSAKATNEVIQSGGEFAWEAPRVYKYRLRVTLPGRAPYETDTRICAHGIREGAEVDVAASPHNRKRVAIDLGQSSVKGGSAGAAARQVLLQKLAASDNPLLSTGPDGRVTVRSDSSSVHVSHSGGAENDRLAALEKLGRLHKQGVLDDAEFAAEKSRILGTPADKRPW